MFVTKSKMSKRPSLSHNVSVSIRLSCPIFGIFAQQTYFQSYIWFVGYKTFNVQTAIFVSQYVCVNKSFIILIYIRFASYKIENVQSAVFVSQCFCVNKCVFFHCVIFAQRTDFSSSGLICLIMKWSTVLKWSLWIKRAKCPNELSCPKWLRGHSKITSQILTKLSTSKFAQQLPTARWPQEMFLAPRVNFSWRLCAAFCWFVAAGDKGGKLLLQSVAPFGGDKQCTLKPVQIGAVCWGTPRGTTIPTQAQVRVR